MCSKELSLLCGGGSTIESAESLKDEWRAENSVGVVACVLAVASIVFMTKILCKYCCNSGNHEQTRRNVTDNHIQTNFVPHCDNPTHSCATSHAQPPHQTVLNMACPTEMVAASAPCITDLRDDLNAHIIYPPGEGWKIDDDPPPPYPGLVDEKL